MSTTKLNKDDLNSAISKYKEYCTNLKSTISSTNFILSSIPEHDDFKDLTSAANLIEESLEAIDSDSTSLSSTMNNYINAIIKMDSEKVSTATLEEISTDTTVQATPSSSTNSYNIYSGNYSSGNNAYITSSVSGNEDELASTTYSSSTDSFTGSIDFSTNIKMDLNGGKGLTETFTLSDGETKKLSTPTRDGYEFLGWSVSTTGPCMIFNGSIDTNNLLSENITLYALWRKEGEVDSTEQGFQYSSVDGKWYYYDENGNKLKGEIEVDGKYYYLDDDTGEVCFGWVTTSDGRKCFYNEYGVRESGGMYLPSEDGSDTRTWYYLNKETGNATRVLNLGGWDFEDWDYVDKMRQRAETYGSDTDWYVTIDCDYPCRDIVFQKIDGEWVPVAGFNAVQGFYTPDGGSRTIPGLHKVTHKFYESSSGPGRITSFVDCWTDGIQDAAHDDGQSIHAGNDESNSGFGTHGCSALTDEEAEWIYDNVPIGSTVDVCGNATGIPSEEDNYRVESPIGYDYQTGNNPIGSS